MIDERPKLSASLCILESVAKIKQQKQLQLPIQKRTS